MGDTPWTVPTTRAPAVIPNISHLWNFELWSPVRKGLVKDWGKKFSVASILQTCELLRILEVAGKGREICSSLLIIIFGHSW